MLDEVGLSVHTKSNLKSTIYAKLLTLLSSTHRTNRHYYPEESITPIRTKTWNNRCDYIDHPKGSAFDNDPADATCVLIVMTVDEHEAAYSQFEEKFNLLRQQRSRPTARAAVLQVRVSVVDLIRNGPAVGKLHQRQVVCIDVLPLFEELDLGYGCWSGRVNESDLVVPLLILWIKI